MQIFIAFDTRISVRCLPGTEYIAKKHLHFIAFFQMLVLVTSQKYIKIYFKISVNDLALIFHNCDSIVFCIMKCANQLIGSRIYVFLRLFFSFLERALQNFPPSLL